MPDRGRLITVEGIDGAGKTTLVEGLAHALPGLVVLREPGGVAVSERIRDLVKDPALHVDPRAEALLYAAARAQLVHERLLPLLTDGQDVLLDRFVDSSLAYQGGGRGLGVAEVAELNRFATAGLVADLTLYVRVEPAVGAARRSGTDRLEQAGEAFFAAVVGAYDALAAADPARVRVLDGARAPEEVLEDALVVLKSLQ
ncbi:dTMP kinase [Baekduia soli]|uniref:Thymidylate kinase n=1 Tax=Baekduia soli TaxID=496014 RepID=A0A5B8TZM8_9ACTN|nr:dTMP kinase [Baekduia soli]QEC46181.1 dTMP kinase [Baekduia soli]